MINEKVIIYIDDYKFNVTTYLNNHTGGKKILKKYHFKDATQAFNDVRGHHDGYVLSLLDKFCEGPVTSSNMTQCKEDIKKRP